MATDVIFPRLDQGMTTGVLSDWLVDDGSAVTLGQPIAAIETEKVNVDLESPAAGTLVLRTAAGEEVEVGTVIAIIAIDGEEIPALAAKGAASAPAPNPVGTAEPPPTPSAAPVPPVTATITVVPGSQTTVGAAGVAITSRSRTPDPVATRRDDDRVPVDRATWRRPHGLSPRRRARIAPADAPWAANASMALERTDDDFTVVTVSAAQRAVMRVVTQSSSIPQFAVAMDVPMRRALDVLGELRATDRGAACTVTDLVIRAIAVATTAAPVVNSTMVDDEIRRHYRVDLNLLVSAGADLLNPVIRDAESLTLPAIAAERRRLVGASSTRALTTEDLAVGTITLSNLGTSHIDSFTAMIFPPQAAVVAVARARTEIPTAPMSISISVDHRVVNGAQAAAYADALRELLQNPLALLIA